jgi:hypothetical protein
VAHRVHGTYLESCNCDAICPCRGVDGRRGGRSTNGICEGALSWSIVDGNAAGLDLHGLRVVFVLRYSDDEPRSPWTFVLYVDERGDADQQAALADVFSGKLDGSAVDELRVAATPLDFAYSGVCAYESTFDYSG